MSPLKKEARKLRQFLNEAIHDCSDRISHLSVWERDVTEEFPGLNLKKLGYYTGSTKAGTFLWVEWLRDGERCGAGKSDIVENQSGHGAFVEGLLNYPSYRQQAEELAAFADRHKEPLLIVPFMPRKFLLQVLWNDEDDWKKVFKRDLKWSSVMVRPDDLKEESFASIISGSRAVATRLSRPLANEIVIDRQLARQLQSHDKIVRYFEEATYSVDGIIEIDGIKVIIDSLYQHRLASRKLGEHNYGNVIYEEGAIIVEGSCLSQAQLSGMAGRRLETVVPGTEFGDEIIASARNGGAKRYPTLVLKLVNPRMKLSRLFKQLGVTVPDKRHILYNNMARARQDTLDALAGLTPIATEDEIFELLTRHGRELRRVKYRPPPDLMQA